jgi:hypothetical protein
MRPAAALSSVDEMPENKTAAAIGNLWSLPPGFCASAGAAGRLNTRPPAHSPQNAET